jgi:RNA polymerase sigma factor (sigma-70 family)
MFQIDLSPEQKMIDTEEAILLKRKLATAMESLTPRQREAIFLKFTEGFSYPQISEMMELTTKGTYKLMARAIDALKQNMHQVSLLLLYRLLLH